MKYIWQWRSAALVGMLGIILSSGCMDGASGGLPGNAGFMVGTIIRGLLIEPAIKPAVTIEIIQVDFGNGSIMVAVDVDSFDPDLSYYWQQVEGTERATITWPVEATTRIIMPEDATGDIAFRVTVRDSTGLEGTDEIQLTLPLGE